MTKKLKNKKESEKVLEFKLARNISMLGGIALKLTSSTYTGLPDRLVLMPGGGARFVELKSTGKKPTPRQLLVHRKLEELGHPVQIINSQKTLDKFIKEVDHGV